MGGERHLADVRIVQHSDHGRPVRLAYTRDDEAFGLGSTWTLHDGEGASATLERFED